jgi:hypothetical protein
MIVFPENPGNKSQRKTTFPNQGAEHKNEKESNEKLEELKSSDYD